MYTFNENDAQALLRVIDMYRAGQLAPHPEMEPYPLFAPETYVGKTKSNGISARDGLQLGSGPVDIYAMDDDGLLEDGGHAVEAFNISASAVAGDTYVTLTREKYSNRWLVIVEDCGEGS